MEMDAAMYDREHIVFHRIDLSIARQDELAPFGAGLWRSVTVLDATGECEISWSIGGNRIPLHAVGFMSVPFRRMFITNNAQPGSYILIAVTQGIAQLTTRMIDAKIQVLGANGQAKLAPAQKQSKIYERLGAIAANTTETIVDIFGRPCAIESLSLGTNFGYMSIDIQPYTEAGPLSNSLNLPAKTGETLAGLSPKQLEDHWSGESGIFCNYTYDEVNNQYTMGLKTPLRFNAGLRIVLKNADEAQAHNAAVTVLVSEWEA